ncbi:TRM11 family SAM-dependent methyltransferase [Cohnella hashimotonis]|uniref:RNA methyltransferase n=1 Tax=Cohnella hashimotonis TaxID=2826895 RepID=A0ABT6TEH7_9BACL|nr:RNA methyltransferase [Cohnella hashimotonis]MDI4645225.1 RNA methyltransferase [Cohnella hashimotonis]
MYIYTYAAHEDEHSLCRLELRSLFGIDPDRPIFISPVQVDPSRSPFIKERLEVLYEGDSIEDIANQVAEMPATQASFKVLFVKTNDLPADGKMTYEDQREIERQVGMRVKGRADMRQPDTVFGIATLGGRWYFGSHAKNRSVWLDHMEKPRQYSMALPTRIARAVANIAVPRPDGIKAVDPCCGIGTVLVEALSMGIDMVGREINPLLAGGARENIAHFGLQGEVVLGPIAEVYKSYDAAVVDLPYNHVSKITAGEQQSILRHARRIAGRVVIVSIEPIDDMLTAAGFSIRDRGFVKKGAFCRYVILCE